LSDASPPDDPAPLVRSGFPAHWGTPDLDALARFDWRNVGVELPYVILVTGRCGSTHLASLLARSGTCGEPLEYFNEIYLPDFPEARAADSLDDYIRRIARSRSSNGRFGLKIDHWRWDALRAMLDAESLFPHDRSAFFLMTRRDMVAQAYSFAAARATQKWHDYGDSPATKRSHVPSDDEMLRELTLIALAETGLSRYVEGTNRPALRLNYEQLLADPAEVLKSIGRALQVDDLSHRAGARSGVRPLEYRRRGKHMTKFRRRFADALAFLEAHREDFPFAEFRAQILEAHGIDVAEWPT